MKELIHGDVAKSKSERCAVEHLAKAAVGEGGLKANPRSRWHRWRHSAASRSSRRDGSRSRRLAVARRSAGHVAHTVEWANAAVAVNRTGGLRKVLGTGPRGCQRRCVTPARQLTPQQQVTDDAPQGSPVSRRPRKPQRYGDAQGDPGWGCQRSRHDRVFS